MRSQACERPFSNAWLALIPYQMEIAGLPEAETARAVQAVARASAAISAYVAGVSERNPPASVCCIDKVRNELQLGDVSYFNLRSRTSKRHSSAAFDSAFAVNSKRPSLEPQAYTRELVTTMRTTRALKNCRIRLPP